MSALVGIGAIAQVFLGHGISTGLLRPRGLLVDLHAFMGILGLALVIYLTYYAFSHRSPVPVRILTTAALLAAAVQAALGLALYSGAGVSVANAHLAGGVILALLVVAAGAVSVRTYRAGSGS